MFINRFLNQHDIISFSAKLFNFFVAQFTEGQKLHYKSGYEPIGF